MSTRLRFVMAALAFALVAGACSSDAAEQPTEQTVLRVFGNYRNGDAEAFRAVLDQFTQQTGIEVSFVGTAAFAARIQDRVRDGDPPDVALFPQPALIAKMARSGFLAPLGSELEEAMAQRYADWAIELGSVDGTLFGAPYRVNVTSLVWYPPRVFAAQGYKIPRTWAELTALTEQMIADGFTPWCLGIQDFDATGWAGTDWVEDIILRLYGPEFYDQWTAGAVAFSDSRVRRAFEEFGAIALTPGQVAGGRRAILTVPVLDAIQPMFEDPPGCLLSRQGSFQEGALPADVEVGPQGDVDVFVLPPVNPGSPQLVVAGEIAAAFTDSDEARALIGFLASPEAGVPWASRGGYTSPLQDFDSALYSSELQRRLGELISSADTVRFDGADQMPPEVGTGTFWEGIVDYIAGEPLDTVLEGIQAGYGGETP